MENGEVPWNEEDYTFDRRRLMVQRRERKDDPDYEQPQMHLHVAPQARQEVQAGQVSAPGPQNPSLKPDVCCLVKGCQADLRSSKAYYRRFRICEAHMKSLSLSIEGRSCRFCQQCGKFHLVEEFDGANRNCRKALMIRFYKRRNMPLTNLQTLGRGPQDVQAAAVAAAQAVAAPAIAQQELKIEPRKRGRPRAPRPDILEEDPTGSGGSGPGSPPPCDTAGVANGNDNGAAVFGSSAAARAAAAAGFNPALQAMYIAASRGCQGSAGWGVTPATAIGPPGYSQGGVRMAGIQVDAMDDDLDQQRPPTRQRRGASNTVGAAGGRRSGDDRIVAGLEGDIGVGLTLEDMQAAIEAQVQAQLVAQQQQQHEAEEGRGRGAGPGGDNRVAEGGVTLVGEQPGVRYPQPLAIDGQRHGSGSLSRCSSSLSQDQDPDRGRGAKGRKSAVGVGVGKAAGALGMGAAGGNGNGGGPDPAREAVDALAALSGLGGPMLDVSGLLANGTTQLEIANLLGSLGQGGLLQVLPMQSGNDGARLQLLRSPLQLQQQPQPQQQVYRREESAWRDAAGGALDPSQPPGNRAPSHNSGWGAEETHAGGQRRTLVLDYNGRIPASHVFLGSQDAEVPERTFRLSLRDTVNGTGVGSLDAGGGLRAAQGANAVLRLGVQGQQGGGALSTADVRGHGGGAAGGLTLPLDVSSLSSHTRGRTGSYVGTSARGNQVLLTTTAGGGGNGTVGGAVQILRIATSGQADVDRGTGAAGNGVPGSATAVADVHLRGGPAVKGGHGAQGISGTTVLSLASGCSNDGGGGEEDMQGGPAAAARLLSQMPASRQLDLLQQLPHEQMVALLQLLPQSQQMDLLMELQDERRMRAGGQEQQEPQHSPEHLHPPQQQQQQQHHHHQAQQPQSQPQQQQVQLQLHLQPPRQQQQQTQPLVLLQSRGSGATGGTLALDLGRDPPTTAAQPQQAVARPSADAAGIQLGPVTLQRKQPPPPSRASLTLQAQPQLQTLRQSGQGAVVTHQEQEQQLLSLGGGIGSLGLDLDLVSLTGAGTRLQRLPDGSTQVVLELPVATATAAAANNSPMPVLRLQTGAGGTPTVNAGLQLTADTGPTLSLQTGSGANSGSVTLNLSNGSIQLPANALVVRGGGGGGRGATQNATASLLLGSGEYTSSDVLERLSLKLHGMRPEQLAPDVAHRLQVWMQSMDAVTMQGTLRSGCVHLVLDINRPRLGKQIPSSQSLPHYGGKVNGSDPTSPIRVEGHHRDQHSVAAGSGRGVVGEAAARDRLAAAAMAAALGLEVEPNSGADSAAVGAALAARGVRALVQVGNQVVYPPPGYHTEELPTMTQVAPLAVTRGSAAALRLSGTCLSNPAARLHVRLNGRRLGAQVIGLSGQHPTCTTGAARGRFGGGSGAMCNGTTYTAAGLQQTAGILLQPPSEVGLAVLEWECGDGSGRLGDWRPLLVAPSEQVAVEVNALGAAVVASTAMAAGWRQEETREHCGVVAEEEPCVGLEGSAWVQTLLIDLGLVLDALYNSSTSSAQYGADEICGSSSVLGDCPHLAAVTPPEAGSAGARSSMGDRGIPAPTVACPAGWRRCHRVRGSRSRGEHRESVGVQGAAGSEGGYEADAEDGEGSGAHVSQLSGDDGTEAAAVAHGGVLQGWRHADGVGSEAAGHKRGGGAVLKGLRTGQATGRPESGARRELGLTDGRRYQRVDAAVMMPTEEGAVAVGLEPAVLTSLIRRAIRLLPFLVARSMSFTAFETLRFLTHTARLPLSHLAARRLPLPPLGRILPLMQFTPRDSAAAVEASGPSAVTDTNFGISSDNNSLVAEVCDEALGEAEGFAATTAPMSSSFGLLSSCSSACDAREVGSELSSWSDDTSRWRHSGHRVSTSSQGGDVSDSGGNASPREPQSEAICTSSSSNPYVISVAAHRDVGHGALVPAALQC